MTTYSDMVTLILVFFVLLFSMSQIDLVKFQAVAESFRNRMVFDTLPSIVPAEHPTENAEILEDNEGSDDYKNNVADTEPTETVVEQENNVQATVEDADTLDKLLAEVEAFLNENNLNNVISASRTDEGVVLVLQEKALFDSGEAEILEPGMPFLDKVGTLLNNIPNLVRVEGHTDSRPISNFRFPSNWELSGARASSVIRYVLDNEDVDESRFMAVGYGDTRPIAPNDSPANWSKNRRVEIVILEIGEE